MGRSKKAEMPFASLETRITDLTLLSQLRGGTLGMQTLTTVIPTNRETIPKESRMTSNMNDIMMNGRPEASVGSVGANVSVPDGEVGRTALFSANQVFQPGG
jgi:hypothetical protein